LEELHPYAGVDVAALDHPFIPFLILLFFFRLKPKSFNPLWFCFLLDYYTPWGGWEYINPRVPAAGASIFKDSTDRPAA